MLIFGAGTGTLTPARLERDGLPGLLLSDSVQG